MADADSKEILVSIHDAPDDEKRTELIKVLKTLNTDCKVTDLVDVITMYKQDSLRTTALTLVLDIVKSINIEYVKTILGSYIDNDWRSQAKNIIMPYISNYLSPIQNQEQYYPNITPSAPPLYSSLYSANPPSYLDIVSKKMDKS